MKKMLFLSLAIVFLSGCNSSYITSSWKSTTKPSPRYNKVLVLALIREEDRSLQEKMEQHLVGDLNDLGYNAVSSLQEYGPKAFKNLSEEEAVNKIKNSGVDGVITIVLLKLDKEKNYYPGHPRYWPSDYYNQGFARYYTTMRNLVQDPGYYQVNTRYSWESNFYDFKSQDLLYSVQTQSFDPISAESLAHEYGRMIVKKMKKDNILEKQKELKAF